MRWVVVTRDSFESWEATTDWEIDFDLRIAVVNWVLGLQDNGPPSRGVLDPFSETWFAQVADTEIWIEYLVLPDLHPPAIVIRKYG